MRRLLAALGTRSADVAALLVAEQLRSGATPPVALAPIARRLRAAVRVQPMGVDGRLEVRDGAFVIRLAAEASWRRRRWTLAHELAHLAAIRIVCRDGGDPAELGDRRSWRELERFCDRTAARLLVPASAVTSDGVDDLDRDALFELYDRHLVSWPALLSRFADAYGALSASVWTADESRRRWRLGWQTGGWRLHELPHSLRSEALDDDIVDMAWARGEVRGTLTYRPLGEERSFEALAIALRRPPDRQLPLLGDEPICDDDATPKVTVLMFDPILAGSATRHRPLGSPDPLCEFEHRFGRAGLACVT
jgi:hypothetical protein